MKSVVFRPKYQKWLGIHDFEVKNRVLLGKWIFMLLSELGVWQALLRRKYVGSEALSLFMRKPGDSHFWTSLIIGPKKFLFPYGSFSIRDGSEIRSREDKWLGNSTLQEQYLALYKMLCATKAIQSLWYWEPPPKMFHWEDMHLGMLCYIIWNRSI
jgi:hypothetical protein